MRKKYHFFVYRWSMEHPFDIHCPVGGILLISSGTIRALATAYDEACKRYHCKPGELLSVRYVQDTACRRQAWLMERAWKRDLAAFEELMGV